MFLTQRFLSAAHRSRLISALSRAESSAITVVRAPRWHGKSEVVDDWLAGRISNARVVRITAARMSRGAFWREVLARCSAVQAQPHVFPVETHTSSLGDTEIEGLLEQVAQCSGVLIVVDGMDRLVDQRQIEKDILRLTAENARLRFVVVTRKTAVLELPATRISHDISVLATAELRLNRAEIADVVRACHVLAPTIVRELEEITSGVPMLVAFAAQHLETRDQIAVRTALIRDVRAKVGDYAAEQALEAAPGERIPGSRLTALSVADMFSADLAGQLTGVEGAEILESLTRSGFVEVQPYVNDSGESVDAGFLMPMLVPGLRRLAARQDEAQYLRLRSYFAKWAWEQGFPATALAASLDVGKYSQATQIVIDHWFSLGARYRVQALHALERVDAGVLAQWPVLTAQLALLYVSEQDHQWKAAELFRVALSGMQQRRHSVQPLERLVYVLIEMIAARTVLGSTDDVLGHAERLHCMMSDLTDAERFRASSLIPHVLAQVAASQLNAGRSRSALETLVSGSVTVRSSSRREPWQYYSVSLRAAAHAVAGEMDRADEQVRLAGPVPPQALRPNDSDYSYAYLAEAYLHLERQNYSAALEVIARLHAQYETIENVHLLVEAEVWALIAQSPGQALAAAERIRDFAGRQRVLSGYASSSLARSSVRAALALQRAGVAAKHMKATRGLGVFASSLLAAQVQASRGEYEAASRLLSLNPPGRDQTERERAEHQVLYALTLLKIVHSDEVEVEAVVRSAALTVERNAMTLPLFGVRALGLSDLAEYAQSLGLTAFAGRAESFVEVGQVAMPQKVIPKLTPRERLVLRELATEGSYEKIADRLFVSANTVRSQIRSLYKKLEVSSRPAALDMAFRHHVLDEE